MNTIEPDGIKGSKSALSSIQHICAEENYSNGKRNGLAEIWDKDFKSTYTYKEGVLNGISKLICIINEKELPCGETNYKNGVESGLSKSYGEGGKQTSIFINTGGISESEINVATKNLISDYDAIEGITWYKDLSVFVPNGTGTGIIAYLGKLKNNIKSDLISFRFKVKYKADSWLFIQSFIVAADDQIFENNYIEFKRDNNSRGITEWYDKQVLDDDLIMIKAIIKSKKAIIRFKGNNNYEDYTITTQEKNGLKNVLDAYELLGGVVIDGASIN